MNTVLCKVPLIINIKKCNDCTCCPIHYPLLNMPTSEYHDTRLFDIRIATAYFNLGCGECLSHVVDQGMKASTAA